MNKENDIIAQNKSELNNANADIKSNQNKSLKDNQGDSSFWAGIGDVKLDTSKIAILKEQPKPLQDFIKLSDSLIQTFAIEYALKFGIFEKLRETDDFIQLKVLTQSLKLEAPAERLIDLFDMLFVHGFLEREGTGLDASYRNSEYTKKYFLKDAENSFFWTYQKLGHCLEHFRQGADAIKTGKFSDIKSDLAKDQHSLLTTACAENRLMESDIEKLSKFIDFNKYKRIVDIGGKLGLRAYTFNKRFPDIEYVVLDFPYWQELQEKVLAEKGIHSEKIIFSYSDALEKVPQADCYLMCNILPFLDHFEEDKLVKNIIKAAKQDADVIILDEFASEKREVKDMGLIRGFALLASGLKSDLHTASKHKEHLTNAGFSDFKQIGKDDFARDVFVASIKHDA